MLSPAVRAARGHECHQVLIQPHRQLGRLSMVPLIAAPVFRVLMPNLPNRGP
jgi:hypothetical protein